MLCRTRHRVVRAMFAVATLFTPFVALARGGSSKRRSHPLWRHRRVPHHSPDRAARARFMVYSISTLDR